MIKDRKQEAIDKGNDMACCHNFKKKYKKNLVIVNDICIFAL